MHKLEHHWDITERSLDHAINACIDKLFLVGCCIVDLAPPVSPCVCCGVLARYKTFSRGKLCTNAWHTAIGAYAIMQTLEAKPDMDQEMEAVTVDPAAPAADWATGLSADVLGRLLDLLPVDSIKAVIATCKCWSRSARGQLQSLAPAHLGPFKLGAFSACRDLSVPLVHTKGHGLLQAAIQLRPAKLANVILFPSTLHLSLAGQPLARGALRLLVSQLPALRSLDLSMCVLHDTDLVPLGTLKQLTALELACVQRVKAHGGVTNAAAWGSDALDFLKQMGQLQALCLNVTTNLQELPVSSSKVYMRQEAGVPLRRRPAELLCRLPRLTRLSIVGQKLDAAAVEQLCSTCTGLQELAMSWMCNEKDLGLNAAALCHLALLPSLHTLALHFHGGGGREPLSLALLAAGVRSLMLHGCNSMELGLSVAHMTGLSRLVWRDSLEVITVDLIVQVVRSLPSLSHLELSGMHFKSTFRLPGDYLFGQLADACPFLQRIVMDDLPLHGSGFMLTLEPWGDVERLTMLRELTVCGNQLLRSLISHLSGLAALEALTITNVQPAEFSHCCRLGCYARLPQLAQLTSFKVLAPHAPTTVVAGGGAAAGGAAGGGGAGANGVAAANAAPAPLPAGTGVAAGSLGDTREPHLHFMSTMTALEHLELRSLHSNGPCLASLATLTRLRSLALGGRLLLGAQGLSALSQCKLPQLQALSLTGVQAGSLTGRQLLEEYVAQTAAAVPAGDAGAGPSTAAGPSSAADLTMFGDAPIPAPTHELLGVLASSFPGLQVLDIGACCDLTPAGLSYLAGALKHLHYLQLREQPLGWQEVQQALAAAPELRWVGATKGGGPQGWSDPEAVVFSLVLGDSGLELSPLT